MDNLFIAFLSALKIYRMIRNNELSYTFRRSNVIPSKRTKYNLKDLQKITTLIPALQNDKVDFVLSLKDNDNACAHFKTHRYSGKYPHESFWNLIDDIYIASPELMFCQLGSIFSFEKLVLIGLEICGTYSCNNHSDLGFTNNILPLTNAENISQYISRLQQVQYNFSGLKNARRAADYLLDNSASPQESRLCLLLTGPHSIGAFALKNCYLNMKIELSKKASQICGQKVVYPDICIPQKKIAIEYDSDFFHGEVSQNRKDKRRINALQSDG